MRAALVVANPRTSEATVDELRRELRVAGAAVNVVDLRAALSPAPHWPATSTRVFRVLTTGWAASRIVSRADAATMSDADVVVAADSVAVLVVWRMRRQNHHGALMNGVPAAVALIRDCRREGHQ